MNTASYSLLTLRPNPERIDTLCVGLLLDAGDWHIYTLPNASKIQAVDANFAYEKLTALAQNLQHFIHNCATLQDVRTLLQHHRSTLQLHEFEGHFAYHSDATLQEQVSAILQESVLPIAASGQPITRPALRTPKRLRTLLTRQFRRSGILGKDVADIHMGKVVEQYPISPQHHVFADFAFKGDHMFFTETVDFDGALLRQKNRIYEGQAKCLALTLARKNFKGCQRAVIVSNKSQAEDAAATIDLLSTVAQVYDLASAADMQAYFTQVEATVAG